MWILVRDAEEPTYVNLNQVFKFAVSDNGDGTFSVQALASNTNMAIGPLYDNADDAQSAITDLITNKLADTILSGL